MLLLTVFDLSLFLRAIIFFSEKMGSTVSWLVQISQFFFTFIKSPEGVGSSLAVGSCGSEDINPRIDDYSMAFFPLENVQMMAPFSHVITHRLLPMPSLAGYRRFLPRGIRS